MLFEPLEPNERFRARREDARETRRRRAVRRRAALAVPPASRPARVRSEGVTGSEPPAGRSAAPEAAAQAKPAAPKPRALPDEVRGVHVTMALASLDGKLEEYLELADEGMNTIELDVKDENGEIGFVPSAVPLARRSVPRSRTTSRARRRGSRTRRAST